MAHIRYEKSKLKPPIWAVYFWCGRRESNPRLELGRLAFYHWTTPAIAIFVVGAVGVEPTQAKLTDLQSAPALRLRRAPKKNKKTKECDCIRLSRFWQPQPESNRCSRLERAVSWASRRWGQNMAGLTGLEPATFCVTGRRSNQLSYAPKKMLRRVIMKRHKFVNGPVK